MTKKVVGNKNADYCVVSSGPDVCKVGNSFIPFDSYQQLSSEQSYVKSVRVNGVTTLTVGSVIKGTQSNAGSGIISGTSQGSGDCVITSGSPTVRFCGNAAAYHGSDVMMNNNNVPGLLYTVEKAAHIAKDAALIPVKKTEDMSYGEMMRLTNDNFFDSEQIAYQETPDVTLGFAKQAANSLIEFSESLVPLHDIEYQDADRIWMVPKGLRERREETTRAIAAHLNNPETAPEIFRFELENQSQKAGALVENVSEVAWAGKAGFSVVKNGIKALSLKSSKQATVTKNASIAAKPHNESATSAKKPECPVGSSVCRLDPVNVATGDFIQVWNVLSLPGIIPVYLQRTYRSTAQQSGLFGAKWSDNWSTRLDITDDEIIYSDPEGIRITYPILGEQLNIRHTHYAHVLLSGELEGSITLFDNRTQLTQHFDHHDGLTRRLSAITDNNQQRIDFHYDADHRLSLITRNGQALLRLQYLQQQLQTITLVDSNLSQPLVTCHYDENGYLNECDAFQQNHLWHEYSSEGYMTRWYDTDQTDYYLEYDNRGRAIRNFSPSGYWGGGFIYDDIHQMTTFYDDEGGQSYYYYNDAGSVTHIIDPLGRESSTEWENNQKVSETNALGETTRYLYHYDGNLAQIIFPDERSIEYQYNDQGQLTRYISPYGDEWKLNYDSHANLTTVTNPQGQVQAYEYSQHGELLKAIQPNGSQWQYEYNAAHQLIKSTNPYDNSTEFQFDELGRLQAYTDALNHTTRYRYSQEHAGVNGSLSELLLPDGAQQQIEYDSERRVVAVTDGEGRTTRYRYGPFDLVTSMVRPDSTAINFEYDSLTRLKKVKSTLGETYTYERDRAGQIIRETDFTGRVLEYRYDRLGRRIATRFPDQHELRWRYAPSGVVIEQSEWLDNGIDSKCVSTTTYEYDERLQLIRATNPDSVVEFEYDAQGRLCCERINGRKIQHKWDDENQTLAHTRFGERELSYAFGQLGELTQLQVNQHSPLQFSYNAVGQEYLRRSQTGFVSASHYTPTGLLAEQRAGRGTENFLNSIRDNPHQPPIYGDVQRTFHYNRAQNVVAIEDSRWQLTQYGYNANDQIIETQFSNHYESEYERFKYDANLNLIEYSTVPAEVGQPWLLLSQQQQSGRIVRRGLHQGHQDCYYDRNGRLEKKVVHKNGYRPQEWRYLWNTQNQLTACFTPEGDCWRYVYDAFGRRLSKTKTVDMLAINEKPAFPLSKKRITGWHYLWSGDQMVEETPVYADGTIAYEASIQWLYQPGAITPAARYQHGTLHYVVADHQGTPREMFTEAGMAIWGGRLHTWGKLDIWQVRYGRAEDDPNYIPCNFRFAGQYEDAETGLFYNRFRYYDKDSGQYISPDPIGLLGGFNPYGYVHNPVGWVDPFGLAGGKGNKGEPETISLYRAVGPDELSNIKQTNAFNNPAGIETKYFTTSGEKASEYGKKAVLGFGDEPYTIVKTNIPKNLISDPKFYAEVDGGIPAYVLPSDILNGLKPNVLNHSPLPGK